MTRCFTALQQLPGPSYRHQQQVHSDIKRSIPARTRQICAAVSAPAVSHILCDGFTMAREHEASDRCVLDLCSHFGQYCRAETAAQPWQSKWHGQVAHCCTRC